MKKKINILKIKKKYLKKYFKFKIEKK
jgi:hypothetical protein